jgi:hypothetical protein
LAHDLCAMIQYKDIKLFVGIKIDEQYVQMRHYYNGKVGGINQMIWESLIASMTQRVREDRRLCIDPVIQYPLYDDLVTKIDMLGVLPDELYRLLWVCRDSTDVQCGKCYACERMIKASKANKIIPHNMRGYDVSGKSEDRIKD